MGGAPCHESKLGQVWAYGTFSLVMATGMASKPPLTAHRNTILCKNESFIGQGGEAGVGP
jgi:hypothetical protein